MIVISARNINSAYSEGLSLLRELGRPQKTRAGDVLAMECPVTTVFHHPRERVLLAPGRVGNPVFHAMSAIWMLAGSRNARWLDQFVHDFSSRFAEKDGFLHGAYGFRLRHHFDLDVSVSSDQLEIAITLLKNNPSDRQVVLQMWDPAVDLATDHKDRPCNMSVALRIRQGKLDITVFNRSNDIIWGLYGENHVQFSFLQEYLAARIGCVLGAYYHVSNNYHIYCDIEKGLPQTSPVTDSLNDPYRREDVQTYPLVSYPDTFDEDCKRFVAMGGGGEYTNHFFSNVLIPMLNKDYDAIEAQDWRMACKRWAKK